MDLRDVLARNVRVRRDQLRLNQDQLGELAGLDRTTISNVERGKYATTIETIEKLARGFGIAPADLLLR